MPDRKKIIEADDLVKELQEWLRERGWRVDKPHLSNSGKTIQCMICTLPNGEGGDTDDVQS